MRFSRNGESRSLFGGNAVWRVDAPPGVTVADPGEHSRLPDDQRPSPSLWGCGILDGTYRLDYDYANQTANGAPTTGTLTTGTEWWAFRSLCASTGRVPATGSKLADTDHQKAAGVANVLHFVDGH